MKFRKSKLYIRKYKKGDTTDSLGTSAGIFVLLLKYGVDFYVVARHGEKHNIYGVGQNKENLKKKIFKGKKAKFVNLERRSIRASKRAEKNNPVKLIVLEEL